MAHNRDYKPEDILFPNQVITESNLVTEMNNSYLEYAMSEAGGVSDFVREYTLASGCPYCDC